MHYQSFVCLLWGPEAVKKPLIELSWNTGTSPNAQHWEWVNHRAHIQQFQLMICLQALQDKNKKWLVRLFFFFCFVFKCLHKTAVCWHLHLNFYILLMLVENKGCLHLTTTDPLWWYSAPSILIHYGTLVKILYKTYILF